MLGHIYSKKYKEKLNFIFKFFKKKHGKPHFISKLASINLVDQPQDWSTKKISTYERKYIYIVVTRGGMKGGK